MSQFLAGMAPARAVWCLGPLGVLNVLSPHHVMMAVTLLVLLLHCRSHPLVEPESQRRVCVSALRLP